jgi:hypothetical protein
MVLIIEKFIFLMLRKTRRLKLRKKCILHFREKSEEHDTADNE